MGACRGGRPPPGRCGGRAPRPRPRRRCRDARRRAGRGRLKLPVGACDAAGPLGAGGRTSTGRRGGAGGACPVFGSSTRRRSVGGTMRPVGGGITGRGAGGGVARSRAGVVTCFVRFFGQQIQARAQATTGSSISTGASTTGQSSTAAGSGAATVRRTADVDVRHDSLRSRRMRDVRIVRGVAGCVELGFELGRRRRRLGRLHESRRRQRGRRRTLRFGGLARPASGRGRRRARRRTRRSTAR